MITVKRVGLFTRLRQQTVRLRIWRARWRAARVKRRRRRRLRRRLTLTSWYGLHDNPDPLMAGWGGQDNGLNWAVDEDELNGPDHKLYQTGPPLLAQLPDPTTTPAETAGTIFGGFQRGWGSRAQNTNDVDPPGPNPGYRWRVEFTDISVRPEFPTNAGNGWGTAPNEDDANDGCRWGARSYGITEGFFLRLDIQDIFGKANSGDPTVWATGEGHALYLTLSPTPGNTIEFTDCNSTNCGAHGFYMTTAYDGTQRWPSLNPLRAGRALQPQLGGFLNFTNCHALNTDQAEGRGAYAFNFPDTFSTITLDACSVTYNIVGGFRDGLEFRNSRGAVSGKGTCGGIYIINGCSFSCPDTSDRSHQISVRGPDFLELRDSHFDCASISVNHSLVDYHAATERLTISNCTGRAAVFMNEVYLGQIDAINGTWFQPRPRPFYQAGQ